MKQQAGGPSMTDLEFHAWVRRLMDGDQAAFEAVYEHTVDDVFRTVTFLMGNTHDVHDLVNEVYIEMWKSLPSYDPNRSFRFWLHGLVIRQVSNWRRKIWRRFRLLDRSRLLEEAEPAKADEAILQEESQQELMAIINKLSYKLRVVIILRYYHDYSLEEIATLLNIPVGTVKSRHHLALKELRKRYMTFADGKVEAPHVYGR
jgi:RNA polymerase sigma-70 factor, ECF subfamily